MREPPVKTTLFWCDECNVPLIGRSCSCGASGRAIELLQPYDVRPALGADREMIKTLISGQFGNVPLPHIVLLNKAGGLDRNDLVIVNGSRFGWLSFDPVSRSCKFDITPEALPFVLPYATKGIIDLEQSGVISGNRDTRGRIGGKRFTITTVIPDGTVIVKYRGRYGTAVLKDGSLRVKEVMPVTPLRPKDPEWAEAVTRNTYHLKNLERNAVRSIKQHMKDRPAVNVSFSGGKDSTAILLLARKAGVNDAFFLDTGIEFPETIEFVRSMGVEIIRKAGDFWAAVEKAGPPAKDNRWCCKLLKQNPLRLHLETTGPCVTVQGNRWYESWNRADLELAVQNPLNPLQLNVSPIRNWRALEVFLYLWWQEAPINPLYEMGIERIGCYPCPSMLESEFSELGRIHPDLMARCSEFLTRWAEKKGLPPEYVTFGLWRWKGLPNKMQELCRQHNIPLRETADGIVVASRSPVPSAMPGGKQGASPYPGKSPSPKQESRTMGKISAAPAGKVQAGQLKSNDNRQKIRQPVEGMKGAGNNGPLPETGNVQGCIQATIPADPGVEPPAPVERPASGAPLPEIMEGCISPGEEKDLFEEVRRDFPLLTDIIYLDSASMGLSPEPVLQSMLEYERNYRSNIGKNVHRLSGIATQRYHHAHEKVARFIGGTCGELVFTKNATEALNIVAHGIPWQQGDRIITTILEHHSNLLPWKETNARGTTLEILPVGPGYLPDLLLLDELLERGGVTLIAVTHASHVLGVITQVQEIARACHEHGALLLVDGSQSVPHIPVDVMQLGADFFCCSGHKMLGPTGTGVLWMKEPGSLSPSMFGSGMAETLTATGYLPVKGYQQYEAGTPHISGGIGLGSAVDYLVNIGMEKVRRHDTSLTTRLVDGLNGIDGVRTFAPDDPARRVGVVSFNIGDLDPDDVAHYLDENADIMVKSGLHGCVPLMEELGLPKGTVRASLALFNNEYDVDMLLANVSEIARGI
jgi:selenocysteine lyase/cysteine desulfurase/3'-phosphoadenosine 5'-phosphosulfate sulfotransferase (PAPS reductase)/FAD synthetase